MRQRRLARRQLSQRLKHGCLHETREKKNWYTCKLDKSFSENKFHLINVFAEQKTPKKSRDTSESHSTLEVSPFALYLEAREKKKDNVARGKEPIAEPVGAPVDDRPQLSDNLNAEQVIRPRTSRKEMRARLVDKARIVDALLQAKCSRGCKFNCTNNRDLLEIGGVLKEREVTAKETQPERRLRILRLCQSGLTRTSASEDESTDKYQIDFKIRNTRVCLKVFLLITGLPSATVYELVKRSTLQVSRETLPSTDQEVHEREACKRKERTDKGSRSISVMGAKAWLHEYAQSFGDKMPITTTVAAVEEIRLPVLSKTHAYEEYCDDMHARLNAPISISAFNLMWRKNFGVGCVIRISLTPLKGTFGLCDTCKAFWKDLSRERDPEQRKRIKAARNKHWERQYQERASYYLRREFAEKCVRCWWPLEVGMLNVQPTVQAEEQAEEQEDSPLQESSQDSENPFAEHTVQLERERVELANNLNVQIPYSQQTISIIIDGMDKRKCHIPHFANPSKAEQDLNAFGLKQSVTGVKVHGLGNFLYIVHPHVGSGSGSNFTIHFLHQTLLHIWQVCQPGDMPPTLHLQMDNCSADNKNRFVLAYLCFLVQQGIFKEILVSFLIVGHTHEDIDAMFSVITRRLRKHSAVTYQEWVEQAVLAFAKAGTQPIVKNVSVVRDYKSWLAPHIDQEFGQITKPRVFRIRREHLQASNCRAHLHYKSYSGKELWKPCVTAEVRRGGNASDIVSRYTRENGIFILPSVLDIQGLGNYPQWPQDRPEWPERREVFETIAEGLHKTGVNATVEHRAAWEEYMSKVDHSIDKFEECMQIALERRAARGAPDWQLPQRTDISILGPSLDDDSLDHDDSDSSGDEYVTHQGFRKKTFRAEKRRRAEEQRIEDEQKAAETRLPIERGQMVLFLGEGDVLMDQDGISPEEAQMPVGLGKATKDHSPSDATVAVVIYRQPRGNINQGWVEGFTDRVPKTRWTAEIERSAVISILSDSHFQKRTAKKKAYTFKKSTSRTLSEVENFPYIYVNDIGLVFHKQ